MNIIYYTGTVWNRHKGTPKPEVIRKRNQFGKQAESRETMREKNRGVKVFFGSLRLPWPQPRFGLQTYKLFTYQLE